jgi:hypothetical protein
MTNARLCRPSLKNSLGSSVRRAVVFAAALAALATQAGCVKVAPYERGLLAHPTMSTDDVSTAMDEHVRAISEGARGGVSGGGGGCGCN